MLSNSIVIMIMITIVIVAFAFALQTRIGVLCQSCVALLTHPRLLAHLLEVRENRVWCLFCGQPISFRPKSIAYDIHCVSGEAKA